MEFLYTFFIVLGIALGTLYFFWTLHRKNMPHLTTLFILCLGIVLVGWIGARLWTYWFSEALQNKIDNQANWQGSFKVFFGLDEGKIHGFSVHGAVVFGLLYSLIIFRWYSQKYQISIWILLDTMAKTTLICQIVGRWGNFFNQELLGEVITSNYPTEYSWIPQWFGEKLRFKDDNFEGTIRHPLFLYESFANFVVLMMMIFVWPRIGMLFNSNLKEQIAWKKVKQKKKNWWGWIKWKYAQWNTLNALWKNNINFPNKINDNIAQVRIKNWKLGHWSMMKSFKMKLYYKQKQEIEKEKNIFIKIWQKIILFLQRDCSEITKKYNPLNLKMTRIGFIFFNYFFAYGVIRLVLQPMRNIDTLINYNHPMMITNITSYIFLIVGFLGMLLCQFVIPYKWRSQKWFYESWYYT